MCHVYLLLFKIPKNYLIKFQFEVNFTFVKLLQNTPA